jgi:hypothetical protein
MVRQFVDRPHNMTLKTDERRATVVDEPQTALAPLAAERESLAASKCLTSNS